MRKIILAISPSAKTRARITKKVVVVAVLAILAAGFLGFSAGHQVPAALGFATACQNPNVGC